VLDSARYADADAISTVVLHLLELFKAAPSHMVGHVAQDRLYHRLQGARMLRVLMLMVMLAVQV
jgi:hypothetical protein